MVSRGGSTGGAAGTRSISSFGSDRRTSFRGERGGGGAYGRGSGASSMMGYDIWRGFSFLEKRRKIDCFLKSGAGLVSTANMALD